MHGTINKNMCVLFSDENDLVMLNSILGSLGAYLFFFVCVIFTTITDVFKKTNLCAKRQIICYFYHLKC